LDTREEGVKDGLEDGEERGEEVVKALGVV